MENQIIELVSGFVLSWVMQGAKKIQAVPVNEGEKVKIRTILTVLSFVVSFGTAYLSGTLDSEELWRPVVGAVIVFASSQLNHVAFIKKYQNKPTQ